MAKGESAVKFTCGKGSLILQSKNERGEDCVGEIQAVGELKDLVTVNISHFESAIEARHDELLTLKIAKSVVTLEDETGWEIISGRMTQGM